MTHHYISRYRSLFVTLVTLVLVAGCDTTDPEDSGPLETLLVEDVPADPTEANPNGPPTSTGRFTLVDLQPDGGVIVLSSAQEDRTDSTSTEWDIGFQGLNLIFNGGDRGPGEGGGRLREELFDDVAEAPAGGYVSSLREWYNYDSNTHIVAPIPGRTIVVRTADGEHYAKLRILSYYEGAPAEPTLENSSRYYTFEYVLQTDGSRQFE